MTSFQINWSGATCQFCWYCSRFLWPGSNARRERQGVNPQSSDRPRKSGLSKILLRRSIEETQST